MKYIGMPFAVWWLFGKSFEKNLTSVFDISQADAKATMEKAKEKYKEILGNLPKFEKGDRFQMNIVGCAMLAAVILSMLERPDVEKLTVYFRNSMMTDIMKWFCRMSGKKKFTMQELGLFDLVPAMCALDYTMSEAGGASMFVRKCTLAGGDAYCDCGYKKRLEK